MYRYIPFCFLANYLNINEKILFFYFIIIKEMPSRRKSSRRSLPPQLKMMNQIVKQLSRSGVKKNLFKKAAKVYHSKKRNMSRNKSRIMF
jgi:hypothetical protein